MNQDSSAEKTEEPTPKKLRDARKKGQVLQVKDLASLGTFFIIFLALMFLGRPLLQGTMAYINFSIQLTNDDFGLALPIALETAAYFFVLLSICLAMIYIITAVSIKIAEVGFLFSTEPIKISAKKINPVEGFKRIYSKKSLVEFGKSFIKSATLISVVFFVYSLYSREIITLYNCDKSCLFPLITEILSTYIIVVSIIFLFITGVDYMIQAHLFKKSMMMTKDEVKREYKESEGSPEIKGERKRIHREIMNSQPQSAKKSSFVVSNPTHYSVAFLFDRDEYKLPYVHLKGVGEKAVTIRQDAARAGVPIIENIRLARTLFAEVEEHSFVPSHFFKPLADLIAGLMKSGALVVPDVTSDEIKAIASETPAPPDYRQF